MDCVILTRRVLLSLEQIDESVSAREPHKADRATNAIRRLQDKFDGRRFQRAGYNRRQRSLYHGRVPTQTRQARPGPAARAQTPKRTAPEKRLGMRLRLR